jgi:uncharacterized protein (TIGR02453 family)
VESSPFTPELFAFLADLREHNDREWFARNKARYEDHLLEPALEFITELAPQLQEISPHFQADARRSGGSLFRIYRDTRFSNDKTPYKTTAGLYFRHERAKNAQAPGFYLHLAPGECFAGCGIWHPDTAAATRIREAIAADGDRWRDVAHGGPFEIVGESLKRPPRGFDAGHPLIDDIKRKSFAGYAPLEERTVTAPGFVDEYARRCRDASPLMRFLCDALDLEF